jgi:response regulator RpfG family c-di-GMP phosphodiesterase
VADTYDALTSSRAYRGAMAQDAALDVLQANMTSQFDPHLVPPFIRMMRGGRKREKPR